MLKNYLFDKNPEYSFKTNIHFFEIPNIHSKEIFIFSKEAVSARGSHRGSRGRPTGFQGVKGKANRVSGGQGVGLEGLRGSRGRPKGS